MWTDKSPYLRNARLDWSSIVIRPWHSLFATLTAGSFPRGIWSYLRDSAANDRLVVRHNQWATDKLVTIESDWTILAIATAALIASDDNMQFTNVDDKIYCMNWVDNMWTLSWTTYAEVTSGFGTIEFNDLGLNDMKSYWCNTDHVFEVEISVAWAIDSFKRRIDWWAYSGNVAITWAYQTLSNGMTIRFNNTTGHTLAAEWTITTTPSAAAKFGVIFNSSMFISWVWSNPNVVYKSVWDVYGDFSNIGSDQFTFGEPITGIATVSEAIFFFTKNTIAITNTADITDTAGIISYTNRKLAVTEWAENHKAIVSVWNTVYYLTSSNSINMIARWENVYGFETVELSDRAFNGINKTMNTLAEDQSEAFGYFLPDTMLIKRYLKSLWSSINDVCIVYDTVKDVWLQDSNCFFTDGIWFKWQNYTTSFTEPKVYLDEYANDDEDSPIPFEYRTKEFFISDPTFKKILRESRSLLDINELAEVTQSIYKDWSEFDTKLMDSSDIPISAWGIAITTVGTETVGTGWWSDINDDYYEINILRTKGNLNTRYKKIQWRWVNSTVAWKVRLKSLMPKVEVLDPLVTLLTE